jgi:hypothetical protein
MNIWQTIKSVLAAMLGVQSSANRNRDFESGNLVMFITAGVVFTIMFMLVLFLFVDQMVLR